MPEPIIPIYNPDFPERADWNRLIKSKRLYDLATRLSRYCDEDLMTASRERVPGLRLALNTLLTVEEESYR